MIFVYVEKHSYDLGLSDQDVLNALYGEFINPLDDLIYTCDAHKYSNSLLTSNGKADVKWVIIYTKILHFCLNLSRGNVRFLFALARCINIICNWLAIILAWISNGLTI